jgi:hypothetical protein
MHKDWLDLISVAEDGWRLLKNVQLIRQCVSTATGDPFPTGIRMPGVEAPDVRAASKVEALDPKFGLTGLGYSVRVFALPTGDATVSA